MEQLEKTHGNRYMDIIFIIVGTALVAISVTCFFEPNGLVAGGVTGLAIIIANLGRNLYGVEIPLWLTNIVLNVPLFLGALKIHGRKFLVRTLFATVFLSISLSWAAMLPTFYSDVDLTVYTVIGSVIQGIGMGLVFKSQSTTGGSDLLASIIHSRLKHISIAKILLVVDTAILIMGFFVFGVRSTMYAIIAVYIVSRVTDVVLDGFDFAKAAFIISGYQDEIAREFMNITERGATFIQASGGYTGEDKQMLLLVMSAKEIVVMKEIIKQIDPKAFIIVTDVREALGEGFQEIM